LTYNGALFFNNSSGHPDVHPPGSLFYNTGARLAEMTLGRVYVPPSRTSFAGNPFVTSQMPTSPSFRNHVFNNNNNNGNNGNGLVSNGSQDTRKSGKGFRTIEIKVQKKVSPHRDKGNFITNCTSLKFLLSIRVPATSVDIGVNIKFF
jgi:hypothetical protein